MQTAYASSHEPLADRAAHTLQQARRRALRLEVCGVDHQGLGLATARGKGRKDAREDARPCRIT